MAKSPSASVAVGCLTLVVGCQILAAECQILATFPDQISEVDSRAEVVSQDQISVVEKTLAELGCADKPSMIVFNKIDAYTWEEKDADDLTPATSRNVSLDELIRTWMSRLGGQCLFISAQERTNLETLKQVLYNKVRELHVQKYPYNDFLFQHYEETE